MFIRYLLIVLSVISLSYASVTIENNHGKIDDFSLMYYSDDSRTLDIDTIVNIQFKETIPSQFTLGHITGDAWFQLKIRNNTQNSNFIVYFTEAFFEEVNLFEPTKNGFKKHSNGLTVKLKDRDVKDSNPAFKITITPNTTKTFYIQTYSKIGQFGEFQIFLENEFAMHNKLSIFAFYLFYFGCLFTIMIFNIFLYITVKDKVYIYYVGYIFFYSIFVFGFSGLSIYFGLEDWYDELTLSIPIFVIFLILFSNTYLNMKHYLPRIYTILNLFILLISVLLLLLMMAGLSPWFEILSITAVVASIVLMLAAIYLLIKGHIEAMYYVIVMLMYRVTMIALVLMKSGLIQNNDLFRYAFLFGSFFEIIFFSFMLAKRLYIMKDEKIRIQNELINFKDKNELYLKNEVIQRTKQITSINNELTELIDEKELLLKEVNHRVKNNFQMVISMLYIEANKDINMQHRNSFLELSNRIKSMSLIHQFIYNADTLSNIESQPYIMKLIDETRKSYDEHTINIHTNIDNCSLNMNEAMALGIIINEVLSNAIKHHHEKNRCIINLDFHHTKNSIVLNIQDNGQGFSPDIQNNSKGLGLQLITQFTKKLKKGKQKYIFENNTEFILTFEL